MTNPLISTIIPVFNRAEMIKSCVDSVLQQSYRPIEIIIVDDGSIDSSLHLARKLERDNPGVIRVLHQANAGPGLAREAGRQVAAGEFIQYLDSDDWLLPNKFADQVAVWQRHQDVDIIYGITQLVDEHARVLASPSKQTGEDHDALFPALLMNRWWHTSTPLYSKRISDLAGPWLGFRPEDWDLEARMGAHSPKIMSSNTLVSSHVEHSKDARVSQGDGRQYLLDEAQFLPRLFACAQKAGVSVASDEMRHFSKWALMRSRHLGKLGYADQAEQLFQLSISASSHKRLLHRLMACLRSVFGWRFVGQSASLIERLK